MRRPYISVIAARALALVALVVATWASAAGHARAADAVVLTVGGDAPPELAAEVRAAVSEALTADGLALVPDGEIALRASPVRLRSLASLAEARALAFELETRIVVAVATWMRPGEAVVDSVAVTLSVGSRTFTSTQQLGEDGAAAAGARAARDVRAQQTRALLIEGTQAGAPSAADETDEEAAEADADAAQAEAAQAGLAEPEPPAGQAATPHYDIIGPTMLGAFGAAGVGLGVYAVLDGRCDRVALDGETCLLGEEPNVPTGAVLLTLGGLAMAGAVVWLLVGATAVEMGPIQVTVAPDGSIRGTF